MLFSFVQKIAQLRDVCDCICHRHHIVQLRMAFKQLFVPMRCPRGRVATASDDGCMHSMSHCIVRVLRVFVCVGCTNGWAPLSKEYVEFTNVSSSSSVLIIAVTRIIVVVTVPLRCLLGLFCIHFTPICAQRNGRPQFHVSSASLGTVQNCRVKWRCFRQCVCVFVCACVALLGRWAQCRAEFIACTLHRYSWLQS